MKHLLLVMLLFIPGKSKAQVYLEIAGGFSPAYDFVASPSVGYNYKDIVCQAELVAITKNTAPAYFGARVGYNLFNVIQPSIGYYFELYSTDPPSMYPDTHVPSPPNRWRFMFGLKGYIADNYFIQAQQSDNLIISIGYTGLLKRRNK